MAAHEEIEEHIHHAQQPFEKIVAGCMAIIAATLAVVSVLAQHYNTEELLKQQQSSDQWAYYQAKDIRRYSAQIAQDAFAQSGSAQAGNNHALTAKYAKDATKYAQQQAEIQNRARELEKERDEGASRAGRLHFGEVFLEVAIVLSSLSILMKNRPFFIGGIAAALAGIVIAATAWTT